MSMETNLTTQIKTTFRALKYRNYRLFFLGQLISLVGTWIENIALSWLVYDLTGSPLMMGTIVFITSLPTLFTPFSGVIIDRYDKYKMLRTVQFCFMAQSATMSYLTLTGQIQIWHIVVLGLILNCIVAIDMPLRQSIVISLVDDHKDLSNAISLNSSCFNFARLLGPAIGGFLIASFGVGICFLINTLSFIPVIIAVILMEDKPETKKDKKEGIFLELRNGFSYIAHKKELYNLIILLAFVSLLGMSYPIMLPVLTKDIYHSDARLLGYFMSSAGMGALIVTLLLASKKTINRLPELLVSASFVLGLSYLAMGLAKIEILSAIFMLFLGGSVVGSLIITNTLIQYTTADEKRGRVMSLHALAFAGTMPFCNLFGGSLAQHIGIMNSFILYGVLICSFTLLFKKRILHAEYKEEC